MSISSNLYAEKVFGEQPIALWSLDDKADYISLINESQRDLTDTGVWSITNGSVSTVTDVIGEPFDSSIISEIDGSVPSLEAEITTISASNLLPYSLFNEDLKTFSVGAYFYSPSPFLTNITVRIIYTAGQEEKIFSLPAVEERWIFLSHTFNIPSDQSDVTVEFDLRYIPGGSDSSSYSFQMNGLSVGQWSEEFQATSLGVDVQQLPSNTSLNNLYGVPAIAYGLQEASAYYVSKENSLLAKNTGVPLVYGASNNTSLFPNSTGPSLVLPGFNFLNENGQYQQFTAEFWLRANASTTEPKRIFGPIASDDGIYVDGSFIKIKVNDQTGSHFVGEWFRPMLVDFRVINNSATLILNGEEVISIDIITNNLEFPARLDENGLDQNWLGFYVYEDTQPFEIDAVGIYPYGVPTIVAKRRWVYGQGVEYPEKTNRAFNGVTALIDYPFSKYANNHMFPDIGRWGQGFLENVSVDDNVLAPPSYEVGVVKFNNKTEDEWLTDLSTVFTGTQDKITLKPTNDWANVEGCIIFDTLNLLGSDTKAFYGLFEASPDYSGVQVLFKIEDRITGNYLSIELDGQEIDYKLTYNGNTTTLYTATGHQVGDLFTAGINLKQFSDYYGGNTAALLGNKNQLKVYVAGSEDFSNTFGGDITRIGFCTERNYSKFAELFNEFGVVSRYENVFDLYDAEIDYDGDNPDLTNGSLFTDLFVDGGDPYSRPVSDIRVEPPSYGLIGKEYFGKATLDVQVDSYWEDYVPLTKLAKSSTNEDGDQEYSLDFIQMNINYPAPKLFVGDYYDTTSQDARIYVTFQYISAGANLPTSSFIKDEQMPRNGVVEPGADWITTRYEIVDGAIVYLPPNTDFNDLAIVTHIEMQIEGISDKPVKVRKLQMASQSLSQASPTAVGTRFGKDIYPYSKSGLYFDYESKNPYKIDKSSTPYLHLTNQSGIRPVGSFDAQTDRGLSIPINPETADNFETVAINFAVKFEFDVFPESPTQIFEVESSNQYLKFYAVSDHPDGLRGRIFSLNTATGRVTDRVVFYQNGSLVREPVVSLNTWSVLGIGFTDNLVLNNVSGAIRITGQISVDSLSHYQARAIDQVQNEIIRRWFGVSTISGVDIAWRYWAEGQDNPEGNRPYTWSQVLVVAPDIYYGVNPEQIYKGFTGTNKIVAGDNRQLRFNNYNYSVYKDLDWVTNTITPV